MQSSRPPTRESMQQQRHDVPGVPIERYLLRITQTRLIHIVELIQLAVNLRQLICDMRDLAAIHSIVALPVPHIQNDERIQATLP